MTAVLIWIVASGLLLVGVRWASSEKGRFWRAVQNHPTLAIMWMANDIKCWEFGEKPGSEWAGPFWIRDSQAGIKLPAWGQLARYSGSQRRFLSLLDKLAPERIEALRSLFYYQVLPLALAQVPVNSPTFRSLIAGILGKELAHESDRKWRESQPAQSSRPADEPRRVVMPPTDPEPRAADEDEDGGASPASGTCETPEASPSRASSSPATGPYSDLWHLLEFDPDARTAVYHCLVDAGMRPVRAAQRIRGFGKAIAQGESGDVVQDVVDAARTIGLSCVRPASPEVARDPPVESPVLQHHRDLWDLLQRDPHAMTAVRHRLWNTGMPPSLASKRTSEFGPVVEAGVATSHDERLALDEVFGAARDALAHLGVGEAPRRSGPELRQAIRDSHRVSVDSLRQQVRDGEGGEALLRELVHDFMLEVMRQSVEEGRYSHAADLEPGEELRSAFMDWVHNDPIRGGLA